MASAVVEALLPKVLHHTVDRSSQRLHGRQKSGVLKSYTPQSDSAFEPAADDTVPSVDPLRIPVADRQDGGGLGQAERVSAAMLPAYSMPRLNLSIDGLGGYDPEVEDVGDATSFGGIKMNTVSVEVAIEDEFLDVEAGHDQADDRLAEASLTCLADRPA